MATSWEPQESGCWSCSSDGHGFEQYAPIEVVHVVEGVHLRLMLGLELIPQSEGFRRSGPGLEGEEGWSRTRSSADLN